MDGALTNVLARLSFTDIHSFVLPPELVASEKRVLFCDIRTDKNVRSADTGHRTVLPEPFEVALSLVRHSELFVA